LWNVFFYYLGITEIKKNIAQSILLLLINIIEGYAMSILFINKEIIIIDEIIGKYEFNFFIGYQHQYINFCILNLNLEPIA
jgi:hypothetical protein